MEPYNSTINRGELNAEESVREHAAPAETAEQREQK